MCELVKSMISLGCVINTEDSRSHAIIITRKQLSKEDLIDLVLLRWSDFSNDSFTLNDSLGIDWSLFRSADSALKILCVSNEIENSEALLVYLLNDKILQHKRIRNGNQFGIYFYETDLRDSHIF